MFQKILVAVDVSERAAAVFDTAVALAEKLGATLRVVQVISVPAEFPPAAAASHVDPLPAHLTELALRYLKELAAGAPQIETGEPIVAIGQPWRAILDTARELEVDLIVVGSHGYHGWDRVLGTTAGKVANLADRSVLVVHERKGAAPEAP